MKTIINNTDRPLPMTTGFPLAPGASITVPDHIAGGERVRGWGEAVSIQDHLAPGEKAPKKARPKSDVPKD